MRHAHAALTPGGLATLQRRLGNRGMGALIQRLTVPTQEPEAGENTATAAQEQAELHAAAQHRADARRLVPAELEEVSAMVALAPPQGPGIVLGPGTKKLLDAVGRLGSRVAGPPSSYVRDPATEHGPPSFVLGKLEDPDGRITVTGDGLLEVTKTKRTPVKGKKGEFKVSHDTATLDLQGKKLTLPKKGSATDSFLAEAQKAVEAEKQTQVLGALRGSETQGAQRRPGRRADDARRVRERGDRGRATSSARTSARTTSRPSCSRRSRPPSISCARSSTPRSRRPCPRARARRRGRSSSPRRSPPSSSRRCS